MQLRNSKISIKKQINDATRWFPRKLTFPNSNDILRLTLSHSILTCYLLTGRPLWPQKQTLWFHGLWLYTQLWFLLLVHFIEKKKKTHRNHQHLAIYPVTRAITLTELSIIPPYSPSSQVFSCSVSIRFLMNRQRGDDLYRSQRATGIN